MLGSSPYNQFLLSVPCRNTVISRQNRGQAEIWPDHPKLLYAKKSIFPSRDCHYKIKHCPKVSVVGIPITRFSYLLQMCLVSTCSRGTEILHLTGKVGDLLWQGQYRAAQQGLGMGAQSPLKSGDLSPK